MLPLNHRCLRQYPASIQKHQIRYANGLFLQRPRLMFTEARSKSSCVGLAALTARTPSLPAQKHAVRAYVIAPSHFTISKHLKTFSREKSNMLKYIQSSR
ncbi:hypothetical protein CDAR_394771 [Caerostris darwini]|uniref:Uncharacterized protein n=1 Tax=Caerostris darwini TaxID=1538125 RepID=A0AAV4M9V0_9ARAC|nr:hypothetical protein CDAR_394771 [Caerostris darwini]